MTGPARYTRPRPGAPELAMFPTLRRRGRARYFSLRQLTEPRFSTLLDSSSMSKPLRSKFLGRAWRATSAPQFEHCVDGFGVFDFGLHVAAAFYP